MPLFRDPSYTRFVRRQPLHGGSAADPETAHVFLHGETELSADPARNDPPRKVWILIVDDDPDTRRLLQLILARAGYEVASAADGRQALQALSDSVPDLLLSDVMMPDLDGFALLKRVRSNPATQTLPVILLTAKTTINDAAEGLGLGADDYLTKPFQKNDLLARVRAKLDGRPVPAGCSPRRCGPSR
ncbi:MAG: response regulator [Anaerolineales bacterium]|nr:response regulator [Anaerolineales bacterium]